MKKGNSGIILKGSFSMGKKSILRRAGKHHCGSKRTQLNFRPNFIWRFFVRVLLWTRTYLFTRPCFDKIEDFISIFREKYISIHIFPFFYLRAIYKYEFTLRPVNSDRRLPILHRRHVIMSSPIQYSRYRNWWKYYIQTVCLSNDITDRSCRE